MFEDKNGTKRSKYRLNKYKTHWLLLPVVLVASNSSSRHAQFMLRDLSSLNILYILEQ